MVLGIDPFNTFEHHQEHAYDNQKEKKYIEPFTHGGIGFIYNFMDSMLPALVRFVFSQDLVA
tara:strand:+ start:124 stop:309 length:186 start_codon:yes stop_codon:yes gene_type:complete